MPVQYWPPAHAHHSPMRCSTARRVTIALHVTQHPERPTILPRQHNARNATVKMAGNLPRSIMTVFLFWTKITMLPVPLAIRRTTGGNIPAMAAMSIPKRTSEKSISAKASRILQIVSPATKALMAMQGEAISARAGKSTRRTMIKPQAHLVIQARDLLTGFHPIPEYEPMSELGDAGMTDLIWFCACWWS